MRTAYLGHGVTVCAVTASTGYSDPIVLDKGYKTLGVQVARAAGSTADIVYRLQGSIDGTVWTNLGAAATTVGSSAAVGTPGQTTAAVGYSRFRLRANLKSTGTMNVRVAVAGV
jgi:hypothetical protein